MKYQKVLFTDELITVLSFYGKQLATLRKLRGQSVRIKLKTVLKFARKQMIFELFIIVYFLMER